MNLRTSIALIVALWNPLAAADGNTKLEIQLGTQVSGQQAVIELVISNTGSVPVLDVQPRLKTSTLSIPFPFSAKLLPQNQYREQLQLGLPATLVEQQFYLPVFVGYADKTGERTTTLALAHFRTTEEIPQHYNIVLNPVNIGAGCAKGSLILENLLDRDRVLNVELLVPPGVTVNSLDQHAKVPANSSITLHFNLCNTSGINKGQFPIYAITYAEQDEPRIQYAADSSVAFRYSSLPTHFFGNRALVNGLGVAAVLVLLLSGGYRVFRRHK